MAGGSLAEQDGPELLAACRLQRPADDRGDTRQRHVSSPTGCLSGTEGPKSRPTNIHRPRCWGDTDAQIRAAGILGYAIQEKLHAIKWYDEVYSELAAHDKRLGPRRATDIFP